MALTIVASAADIQQNTEDIITPTVTLDAASDSESNIAISEVPTDAPITDTESYSVDSRAKKTLTLNIDRTGATFWESSNIWDDDKVFVNFASSNGVHEIKVVLLQRRGGNTWVESGSAWLAVSQDVTFDLPTGGDFKIFASPTNDGESGSVTLSVNTFKS